MPFVDVMKNGEILYKFYRSPKVFSHVPPDKELTEMAFREAVDNGPLVPADRSEVHFLCWTQDMRE
jgi:hypothetical protein